jgi:hypothetical protein
MGTYWFTFEDAKNAATDSHLKPTPRMVSRIASLPPSLAQKQQLKGIHDSGKN